MKELEIISIRKAFTENLQRCNFKGKDYAEITRAMKKWLCLSNDNKWSNDTDLIAKAEWRAVLIMKSIKFNSHWFATMACRLACIGRADWDWEY